MTRSTRPEGQQVPRIRVSGPAGIASSIPALLGFHPEESLVAVLFGDDRVVRCVARTDLDEGVATQALRLVDVSRRADATSVVLLAYSAVPRGLADEVQALVADLAGLDVDVRDALWVHEGRVKSYLCEEQGCCPPDGWLIPDEVTELEAHRVVSGGLAVQGRREDLEALYRPRPDLAPPTTVYDREEAALSLPLGERCAQALSDAHELLEASQDQDRTTVSDEARARLALLLHDSTVRDLVLATLAQAEDLRPAARALTWLALTSAETVRGPAAASAAFLHVATGDNPVACWALVELAPDESLARLVRLGMEQGVPPDHARRVLAETLPAIQERLAHI